MNDQRTILPLGGAAQLDNDQGRWDHIRPDQYDQPIRAHISAKEIAMIGLVVGCLGIVVLTVLAIVQGVSCWGQRYELTTGCRTATALFWGYTIIAVLLTIASAAMLIWSRVQRVRVEVARAAITRDPYSNPLSVFALPVDQSDRFAQRLAAEIAMAPYKILPAGLDAYSVNNTAKADPPLALPAPDPITPIPDAEWLPWLDAMPHLLIAGRTGDGKTTLGNALLGRCINAGDQIAVIDPKWQPGKWRGVDPLAGSLEYDALYDALEQVMVELGARYQDFNHGQPSETFPRLRVVIDEVPTILLGAVVGGKIIHKKRFQQWLTFATKLGSIAREVNVHVWLFSQSPLIKDLYFSSSMRDNFNRIALASQVRELLSEESNKATKEALINLTKGKAHTAAMEYRGSYHVLDLANVPRLAQERVDTPQVWQPQIAPSAIPNRPAMPPNVQIAERRAQIAWCASVGYTTREILALLGGDYTEIVRYARLGRTRRTA